jgi:putative PIN family toxin of toxin-antitoxin system
VRVVLDTSTIVSALLWNRKPRAIFDAALRQAIELHASARMIEELASVMPRPKLAAKIHASGFTAQELIVSYAQVLTITAPALLTGQVSRDPKDDQVLAARLPRVPI